jgi:hypothetical protein
VVSSASTQEHGIRRSTTTAIVVLLLAGILVAAGCSQGVSIVGMWKDTDGTTRVFRDDGTCQNVAKIDIGGPPPVYTLSDKPDTSGRYLLDVSQGGYNETEFYVERVGADHIRVYEGSAGRPLYDLTRQRRARPRFCRACEPRTLAITTEYVGRSEKQ